VTFTFTVSANISSAAVGDTVIYDYCGQNTSSIPLEVVRLVDDRIGVLIELPTVTTTVGPGESICNRDLGIDVTYVVQDSDSGADILNNAVATVRTLETQPRTFQSTAQTTVSVSAPSAAVLAAPTAQAAPPYSDLWPFDAPTCTVWTVVYPDDLPPSVVTNWAEILVQYSMANGQSGNTTLRFTTDGRFTGTQTFVLSEAPQWSSDWTSYQLQNARVAGTNYVWNGPLQCQAGPPTTTSTTTATTTSSSSSTSSTSTTLPISTTLPPGASAAVNPNCGQMNVDIAGWPQPGTVLEIVIDGVEQDWRSLDDEDFTTTGNFHAAFPWSQDQDHTWTDTIIYGGQVAWSRSGTFSACQPPSSTSTTEPSTTTSTSTTSTTEPPTTTSTSTTSTTSTPTTTTDTTTTTSTTTTSTKQRATQPRCAT
jgi:hypothetical protein